MRCAGAGVQAIVVLAWAIQCAAQTDAPTDAPTDVPTAAPTTIPCVGDRDTWSAGYGGCETYAFGEYNADFCTDVDLTQELSAEAVCSECGVCYDTAAPTAVPTAPTAPTVAPTAAPTAAPAQPTAAPTNVPSVSPSAAPTAEPTFRTLAPTPPTAAPTTVPTAVPTASPTNVPTQTPTEDRQGYLYGGTLFVNVPISSTIRIPTNGQPHCDLRKNFYAGPNCTAATTCTLGQTYEAVPLGTGTDRVCHPVKTCTAVYEYEGAAPTLTTDRICLVSQQCFSNQHISVVSTASSDTVCRNIVTVCPDSYALNSSASLDAASVSAPVTGAQCVACAADETAYHPQCDTTPASCPSYHSTETCTAIADVAWSGCGSGQYHSSGSQPGHPSRSCVQCTRCLYGELAPCTATTDAVCDEMMYDAAVNLQPCPPEQYRNSLTPGSTGTCTPCTRCGLREVEVPCSVSHDRQCASFNSEVFVVEYILGILVAWLAYLWLAFVRPLLHAHLTPEHSYTPLSQIDDRAKQH